MPIEMIISQLVQKKWIGAVLGELTVFGQQLVRPFDLAFELRGARIAGADLLNLTLVVNPGMGVDPDVAEMVIEEPKELRFADNTITFQKASYVRFEETVLVVRGREVDRMDRGRVLSTFPVPAGPAVALTR